MALCFSLNSVARSYCREHLRDAVKRLRVSQFRQRQGPSRLANPFDGLTGQLPLADATYVPPPLMTNVGGRPIGLADPIAPGPFGTPEFQRISNSAANARRLLWHEEHERINEIMTSCAERAVGLRPSNTIKPKPVDSDDDHENSLLCGADPTTLLRHKITKTERRTDLLFHAAEEDLDLV